MSALRALAPCHLGLGLAAAPVLGGPLLAQEEILVRWHDVRALGAAAAQSPRGVDLRLHLSSTYLDSFEPDRYDVRLEERDPVEADALPQLVLDGLGEDWPDDDLFVDERGGFLRVEGDPDSQREVEKILGELRELLLRSAELEVFVLSPASIPPGTRPVLTADEADALVAAASPLDYSRSTVRIGQRVRAGATGMASVLMDYDVEVAQKARAADPQVSVLRAGTEVGALLLDTLEGGFFLRVWGRRGVQSAAPRRLTLGSLGGTPLEMASMSSTMYVGSAAIPDGGGVLLGQDWNAGGVWLVRARGRGERPSGPSPFVPLGALCARRLIEAPPYLAHAQPSGGWMAPDSAFFERFEDDPVYSPDDVLEELFDERERTGLGGSLQLVGDALYVRGSEALLARSVEKVRALGAELAGGTVEVELRLGLVERAAALAAAREAPAELAQRLEHRILGTCREGDALLVIGGTETFYLGDHDVEIAEAAVIADPIIDIVFDGVSFWFLPNRSGADTLSAWVDLAVNAPARELEEIAVVNWEPRDAELSDDTPLPTGTFDLGSSLELAATARASVRTLLQLEDGAWHLACCTGLGGSEKTLVAVLRATRASR